VSDGNEVRIIGIDGMPEVAPGDDLDSLIGDAIAASGMGLERGDIVVVTHKIVSKAEGQVVDLRTVEPSPLAAEFGERWDKDSRKIEVVLREARRIVRMENGLIIAETRHGFVCANAGVDASNASPDSVVLLPKDPDASAMKLRGALEERFALSNGALALIVSDSFGRPWRQGTTDVALGVAGIEALRDLRGVRDGAGYVLQGTQIAVADELAAAAELVLGKTSGCPAAVVRGLDVRGDGSGRDLVMPPERDLFR
jgi:coenzyme F420-0:L-glutamate ligase / coenzyme F420-1:gamma-L-glutamate ligase